MKRFMIVDDDDMSRLMLQEVLSEYAQCDTAENGEEGLKLFEKALAEGNLYDLLCIDLIMPKMSGLELIKSIRCIEQGNKDFKNFSTKIFVISSSESTGDKVDLILNGLCDDYIVKPFNKKTLIDDLSRNYLT